MIQFIFSLNQNNYTISEPVTSNTVTVTANGENLYT